MRYRQMGSLMACSPVTFKTNDYKFGLEIDDITVVSNVKVKADYFTGKDLSPLMERLKIDHPVAGEPITVKYRIGSSAFLFHRNWATIALPKGYDSEYNEGEIEVIRFKEGMEIAKGEHTLTISWIMSDGSALSANTTIKII